MPNLIIEDNGNICLGFGQAQKYDRAKPINISQTINLSLKGNYQTISGQNAIMNN